MTLQASHATRGDYLGQRIKRLVGPIQSSLGDYHPETKYSDFVLELDLPAGGNGTTVVRMKVHKDDFARLARLMFMVDFDKAAEAFASALQESLPQRR
jgi:hypothetical protein